MEKKLKNLRWAPRWVSHLGCIKGCLTYLGLDISDAWLYGATGHAFIINMHEDVCPSGPTAWNTEMLFKLGTNIGYNIEGVFGLKSDSDFVAKQERAWINTRQAIDQGLPCYGWELDIPEFYVIYGYDDEGYYFSGPGCSSGEGPKKWKELGNTRIGVLEVYTVRRGKAADDIKTIKEALQFVLEHCNNPTKWTYPKYKSGLAGFDNWMQAVEAGRANGFGMAYNAAVWGECRNFAVQFLIEASDRIGGKSVPLFDEAIRHYEVVAQNLQKVSDIFPFPPKGDEIKDIARCKAAVECIREARNAEELGLQSLSKILQGL